MLTFNTKKASRATVKIYSEEGQDVSPKPLTHSIYPAIPAIIVKSKQAMTVDENLSKIKQKIHSGRPRLKSKDHLEIAAPKYKTRTEKGERAQLHSPAVDDTNLPLTDIKLTLSETPTIWLMSVETKFSLDIQEVSEANEKYRKLTEGKERNRNRCQAETQTDHHTDKAKGTMTTDIVIRDAFVNASAWDLYDTYMNVGEVTMGVKEFQLLLDTSLKTKSLFDFPAKSSKSEISRLPIATQNKRLFSTPEFHYATLVTERLLAANTFQNQQALFKTYVKSRYQDTKPTLFSYKIVDLWTFVKEQSVDEEIMVSAMDWNPSNQDLLAVGYGHYKFGVGDQGYASVWSSKNPKHPERDFSFDDPVTAVSYSVLRPNIMAVGCSNGDVYAVDVSKTSGNIRLLGSDKIKVRHGPVWKIKWFTYKDVVEDREELLAVGEGGVLVKYTYPDDDGSSEILKLKYVLSVPKSPKRLKNKLSPDSTSCPTKQLMEVSKKHRTKYTFSDQHLSGLSFSLVTKKYACYVSTKEGVIIKCILRNPFQCTKTYPAHQGQVYVIQHSPFTDAIYITCGSDWSIKIWLEGLSDPLITLQTTTMPVIGVQWSPTHSTMFASISGTQLSVWDIARKHNTPIRVENFEDCTEFTTLLFSDKGTNIVIGDQSGKVKVLHLSELPRQPFLQAESLTRAIENALYTKPKFLARFKKVKAAKKQDLKSKIF